MYILVKLDAPQVKLDISISVMKTAPKLQSKLINQALVVLLVIHPAAIAQVQLAKIATVLKENSYSQEHVMMTAHW
jgi:hypothetical protein